MSVQEFLLFHICRSECEARGRGEVGPPANVISDIGEPVCSAPPPPASQLFQHLFGMSMHSFHEGAHVLRVHVGVKAVAQVGDVALRAETLQHLLHDVGNALLKEGSGQRSGILPSLFELCGNMS